MDSLEAGLANGWALVLTFVPKILFFAAILIGGYFLAKLVCRGLNAVLERVGFNRVVERGGIKRALDRSGWEASQILSKLVFYFVMLFVLQMAFGVFGTNPISQLLTGIIAFLPNVFVAIIIVTLAAAVAAAVKQVVQVALGGLSYGRFVASAASIAILVVGITAALNQLQIAPAIVNGLFYAMLATIVGCTIVAVGGGGIEPMRKRWENALGRIEKEAPRIQGELASAGPRLEAQKQEWKERARAAKEGEDGQETEAVYRSGLEETDERTHPRSATPTRSRSNRRV
jgi:hypothetical protein